MFEISECKTDFIIYARILEVDVISAVKYDKYANVMIINGSRTGVVSVYLVVIDATMPNKMPIITPPHATTKKDVAPNTTSTAIMFSCPISANEAKSR